MNARLSEFAFLNGQFASHQYLTDLKKEAENLEVARFETFDMQRVC